MYPLPGAIRRYLPALLLLALQPRLAYGADAGYFIGSSLKMIWGLLIVLGILLIIYGIARKRLSFMQVGSKGLIRVIETKHLLPKKSLFLVEVGGKRYLLGSGSDSIQLITPVDAPEPSPSFQQVLTESESGPNQ